MKPRPTNDAIKFMQPCFLCSRSFQYGPHRYEGRAINSWDIVICDTCDKSNWDGLVTEQHPRLMKHLAERGVTVKMNPRGWLSLPKV
jgi:hypothetical protein